MAGDAKWLIEAIEQRKLVEYMNRQDVLLLEPQVYARVIGKGDVVIGYQVRGHDKYHSAPDTWFEIPIHELGVHVSTRRFLGVREIPLHFRPRIQEIYCRAKAK